MHRQPVPNGTVLYRREYPALPVNRSHLYWRGRNGRRSAFPAGVVRRGWPGGGLETRVADRSWNRRARRGEISMNAGATRLGFACDGFALAATLCVLPLCPHLAAQEKPKHTVFYTHGRIYTNDPANPWRSEEHTSELQSPMYL